MRFIVSKERLELAVKNICRVIEPKQPLPILQDILFDVNDKFATLTGSDTEVQLQFEVVLNDAAEGGGKFCVNAQRLMDALAPLKEQPVTITANTEDAEMVRFELKHESGCTFFPIENADEYPVMADPEHKDLTGNMVMPAKSVAQAIQSCIWTTSNDDLRPIMNGICFDLEKDKCFIVASDGHTLMRFDEKCGSEGGNFVIPKKVAKILTRLMTWDDNDDIYMEWSENLCMANQEGWRMIFRLIEGKYPQYDAVIPKDHPFYCVADRADLLSSIQMVAPFSPDSSNMITWAIRRSEIMMTGDNAEFDMGAVDTIKTEADNLNDENIVIGLKASKIASILSKMPYPKIVIRFNTPDRAIVFEEKRDTSEKPSTNHLLGLSMPMLTD